MRINKLTASFGKLENETLRFHPGLNVVYAPNESGKSTWCAFIKAMLYGVDSSERSRAGYLPDKVRYAPWSGAPMEGRMDLTSDNFDITVTRTTKAKSAPMRDFTAVYTDSGVPVEGVTGANAGELLTGVTRDVFCRSAFIAQGSVAVTGSPELEKRISALVSTGEEQTSYSEADETLRAWQRKRRFNRRGYLPELEAQMDDTQRTLASMEATVREIEDLEAQLNEEEAHCAALDSAVTESRKRQRKDALEKLSTGRTALKGAGEAHDEALANLANAKEAMRDAPFGAITPDEADAQAEEDLSALAELRAAGKNKPTAIWSVLLFVLAAACAAFYTQLQSVFLMIGAGIFGVAAVALILRFARLRRAAQEALDARHEILDRYGARSAADIHAALDTQREIYEALLAAQEAEIAAREEYDSARERHEALESEALGELDFASGTSEAAQLSRELALARQNAENLSSNLSRLRGKLAAVGDPLVLASELKTMEEEYDALNDEYDALTLAVNTLRAADSELQGRFSPRLGKLAAEYMSFMTGGRYSDVLIDRDFSARARTQGDIVAREAEYLSSGTLDLMYLAVRLAVCELAMPTGEACPLIIDDALVNLDEERLGQAMKLLRELSRERQIILFTCREVPTT